MKRRVAFCAGLFWLHISSGVAQTEKIANEPWPARAMPSDRADASYAMYSSLLPLGETAGEGWPKRLWLVSDTTITAVAPDIPCAVDPNQPRGMGGTMNAHTAMHAPEAYRQDLAEILEDFDRHCHERLTLDGASFHVNAPLRLLSQAQQQEFQGTRFGTKADPEIAAKYKGAPALYSFSQVYFNAHHTVAALYATHWCGGLCGQGFWVAFLWKDGRWQAQNWATTSWIS